MTNKELVIKAIEIINEVYGQKIISYNGLQEISGNPNYIGGEFTIKGKTVDLGFNEN